MTVREVLEALRVVDGESITVHLTYMEKDVLNAKVEEMIVSARSMAIFAEKGMPHETD